MKKYLSVFESSSLFENISSEHLLAMLDCLSATTRTFAQNSPIFHAGDSLHDIGFLLEGEIQIERDEADGNRTIIGKYEPGNLFGEALVCSGTSDSPFTIIATKPSTVMFINYLRVLKTCSNSCTFHTSLIQNMITILARKNIQLNQKLSHLSKRTTREKILSYLNNEAYRTHNKEIDIPYNRQELADYLCVERSAMSAELARMKKDGLISYHKNHFTLL